ncbi:unnamed protein product [Mycena citricolor]|uniref:HpcH/HpaI aldolase/citrate lyase domain-containing protein n=2 Tax=Mycena citricolor TaxID=2018698 RepID=A0AAD2K1S4_9AGAR|nr:unnamed protein product [Mycena citricolor]CAK5274152.1 unnamed protein product [Mycena citricolor]
MSAAALLSTTERAQFRAPTLQQPANLTGILKSGKIAVGSVLSYPSVHIAKTVAACGADWCWIDTEHVAWSPTLLIECIQIINQESGGSMVPIVRVPNKKAFDYMAWCLDAGAGGVILPHLETVEEMQAAVDACRFPPVGHRSFPPFSFIPGVTDTTPAGDSIFTLANKHVAIIPQIETRLGFENLDAIASMEQVPCFMVGVADMRMELGLSPALPMATEPEWVKIMEHASAMAKKHDIPMLGLALGEEMIKGRIAQGFKLIASAADFPVLAGGLCGAVVEARAFVESM